MEAEGTGVTDGASHAAFVGRTGGMGAVFEDFQTVFVGDLHDGIHIDHQTGVVDNVDGFGLFGDLAFNIFGIQVEGAGIDISENRDTAFLQDHQTGGNEGVGGDDDFITGFDVEQLGDDMHTGCAVGTGISILGAVFLGELALELLSLGTHGQSILLHGGESSLIFSIIVDTAHEGVGDFEFHAVVGGVAAGNTAFGISAGIVFLVDSHSKPPLCWVESNGVDFHFHIVSLNDAFAGLACFCSGGKGLLDGGHCIVKELFFDLGAESGICLFGESHDADLDIGALRGLNDLLLHFGEALTQLVAVGIIPESFGDIGFIQLHLIHADHLRAPVEQQRGLRPCGVVVMKSEKFGPGGGEIPQLGQQDHCIFEGGVEPLEDTQGFLEVEQTFAAAVSGDDDKVFKPLQSKGFNDFTHKVGKGVGFHIDGSGEHTAGKGVVQGGGSDTSQFFSQFGRHEIAVADIHIQRQMSAVLFAQSVGDDDGFVGLEILLHFGEGHILHTVTFHLDKSL